MDSHNIFEVLFPIGFIFAGFVAYFAHKNNWRIAKWF
jgi:5-methylcytosine-specific restriction endonuclease McrBC regulatory subunit McrC